MFFKKSNVYENKLSEQLSDDNPYKKELITMETPSDKHPIYTSLVWGLFVYSWMICIFLVYKQAYCATLSLLNMVFVSWCIILTYKKEYMLDAFSKYRKRSLLIFIGANILSVLFACFDFSDISWKEIFKTFAFQTINNKSYLTAALFANTSLGICLSYYNCPYRIYRAFHSTAKMIGTNEFVDINKSFICAILILIGGILNIYDVFSNTYKDAFGMILKGISVGLVIYIFPLSTMGIVSKKYVKTYQKAKKLEKGN